LCNPKDAIIAQKIAEENEKTYKKLKDLIDKIKRLNSSSLLNDPKLRNFTNYAKIFLKQNASKLNQNFNKSNGDLIDLEKMLFASNNKGLNKTFLNLNKQRPFKTKSPLSIPVSSSSAETSHDPPADWLDALEEELDLKEKMLHATTVTTSRSPQQIADLINDIQNSINQGVANLNLKELGAAGTVMANAQKQAADRLNGKHSSTGF
jgi:hypothetical protein